MTKVVISKKNNKILFLDDRDVSELVYNLIEYALLREEVRRKNKLKL